MGRGQYILVGDQHTAALVLREQTQPCGLLDQHLPWPFTKAGRLAANNPSRFVLWPGTTHCADEVRAPKRQKRLISWPLSSGFWEVVAFVSFGRWDSERG
jgi:hypothetical protein